MIEQCYNNEIDTWLINANISVMFFGVIVSNKCRIKNYSIMLCVDLIRSIWLLLRSFAYLDRTDHSKLTYVE